MKFQLTILLALLASFTFSQSKKLERIIESKIFDGERKVSIFLPDAYSKDDTSKFIVAFVFDGQFEPYFDMTSSMMSYYEQTGEGVPMIMVGIHTGNRWKEFAPEEAEDRNVRTTGGADQLTKFISTEVVPLLDSEFRIKDFFVGVGHSLGGTYVLNEAMKDSSIFKAVIAASPNLRMYDEQIVRNAKEFLEKDPNNNRFCFTTVGTIGEIEHMFNESLIKMNTEFTSSDFSNLYWSYEVLEGKNHMTTFIPTFDNGYLKLSSKLELLDDELVKMGELRADSVVVNLKRKFYEIALFLGKRISMNAKDWMKLGSRFTRNELYATSIPVFEYALQVVDKEDVSNSEKNKLKKGLNERLTQSKCFDLGQRAKKMADVGNLKKSSELYEEAFAMNHIRATHYMRINSVSVFARTGKTEQAFEQLDLLANKFKLGGNSDFITDPNCASLHSDKRWEKLMDKLEKNGKLYE